MDGSHLSRGDRTSQPAASAAEPTAALDGNLLVVSNRQPYSHRYEAGELAVDTPSGGLAAGLDPVMQTVGGTWIAWGDGEADRDVVDGDDCVPAPPGDPSYTLERVWLSEAEVEDYYYGFSNRVLWPVCHGALTNLHSEGSFWRRYRDVNRRFVETAVERAGEDDVVWFQDYHLALAPAMARRRLPDGAVVTQFWHIPWPSWDTFRGCPHRRELLDGLLGNDVLGFHVDRYRENFLTGVDAALADATVDREAGTVRYDGHRTRVVALPLGVPVDEIARRADSREAASYWSSFADRHALGDTVAVGVDRLDYTKGIPERLRALERFWERNPGWRGELTYVQNASESRSRIPAYRDVQERVEAAVERVNDRFGTPDWEPVVAFRDHVSRAELAGLYRHGDLALVSPVRDGMNLVAQEYVAAQVDGDGVLVLSDQTGAHDVLDGAVTATPQDPDAFAAAIDRAVTMPAAERRDRMRWLRRQVAANDLSTWVGANLRAAARVHERPGDAPEMPTGRPS